MERRLVLVVLAAALTLLLDLRTAASDPGYDAWGGWLGVQSTATGRFRTERIDGVWWLITPDGHGFFSVGVDHLRPEGDFSPPLGTAPYHDNIIALYGNEAAWAAATVARLHGWGFNTVGAFSRPELFAGSLAYTVTLALAQHAPAVPGVPPAVVARVTRDYFDPAFPAGVAGDASTAGAACAADPWCVGVFTDNEMALGQSLAQPFPYVDAYLLLPPGAPGKLALQAFLEERYGGDISAFNGVWGLALASFDDIQQLTGLVPAPAAPPASPTGSPAQVADRRAFDAYVAARFHEVVHDGLRAVSPDLLILGSRLLILSTRPEVVAAIAPFVDVLTVNYYEISPQILAIAPNYPADYGIPFTRMFDDLDTMYRIAGKPILIGEFSYRAADSGLPNSLPPFFPTLATQADRAHAAGTYLRRVVARPYVVGAHWFQYMDQPATGRFDGENQNFGLVKITDEPWPEVTERFQTVTADAAPRRLLAPGGGSRADCFLEWAATAPADRLPGARFVCRDGDPACDTDGIAGQCTVEVLPCAAVADTRPGGCDPNPPESPEVRAPSERVVPVTRAALAASLATVIEAAGATPGSCGPAVPVEISLGTKKRVSRRLRTVARAAGAVDRDTVTVRCQQGP